MTRKSFGPGAGGRYRSILVPLDGSCLSEQAVPLAVALAERARAKLRLVLVSQLPAVPLSTEERQLYVSLELAARGSSVPVLLVRPEENPSPEAVLENMSQIMVPVDGSALAETILDPPRS